MELKSRVSPPSSFSPLTWPLSILMALDGVVSRWKAKKFRSRLSKAFGQIEAGNEQVMTIHVNAKTYWAIRTMLADEFFAETNAIFGTGVMGYLWGASIVVERTLGNYEFRLVGGTPYTAYFTREVRQ